VDASGFRQDEVANHTFYVVDRRTRWPCARTEVNCFYICEVLIRHCEDLEDLYLAERSLDRIRSGEEPTIPLADVVKRHGLED